MGLSRIFKKAKELFHVPKCGSGLQHNVMFTLIKAEHCYVVVSRKGNCICQKDIEEAGGYIIDTLSCCMWTSHTLHA